MVAGGFRFFFVASRQNLSFRKQFFLPEAPQAHSVSAPRNQRFPGGVLLPLFLPALRLFPGQTPAQELMSLSVGNLPMSEPISARTLAELFSFIPGTLCNNSHWGTKPSAWI